MSIDKSALFKIGYGVYLISSSQKEKHNGQIATVVFQVTSEPVNIATCINKQNLTHEFINNSKKFGVSVLEQNTPISFIGKFGFKSGRDIDKFSDTTYALSKSGIALATENSVAIMEAKVINSLDLGTHTMFIGKLIECQTLNENIPMTYAYYHEVKKMKAPKTAPTFQKS